MSHVRQQIREAAVTKLKEIVGFSNRVYPYRTTPHKLLPDVVVYTTEDEVNHEYDADNKEIHILTIRVEIRAKVTADIDDTLDDLCVSVEKELMEDVTLGGLLKQLEQIMTEITIEGDSDKKCGLAAIEFEGWYRVERGDPETVVS